MAKDIKLLIGASAAKAEAAIRELQRTGHDVTDRLERDFKQLGIVSSQAFDNKRKAAQSAYDKIKSSGSATADELGRSQKALASRLIAIDTEQFSKREGLLQKFKANWLGATAAMGAAYLAVTRAWALVESSAQSRQGGQAFANLAASQGASADQIIADLRRVSAETISVQDLVTNAGTSMLLGIDAKVLPKLMEIARASSRITGATITKSFGDLSLAVGRQSKMILDNLGIIVPVDKANAAYAATLGKTAAALNDVEKKQAFLNATLAAGQKIIESVGANAKTEAEKFAEFSANVDNAKQSLGALLSGPMSGLAQELSATTGWLDAYQSGRIGFIEWMFTGADSASEKLKKMQATNLDATVTAAGKALAAKQLAAKQSEEATKIAEETAKKQEEATKLAATAIDKYSKSLAELGREQLKLSDSKFSSDLERQEQFLKKTGTAAANLAAPIRSYLSVLSQVYGQQLSAQRAIADTLKDMGADQAAQLQQQLNIANVEKLAAEARLKGWQSYYDKLRAMHTTTLADMQKKQEELLAVKKFGADLQAALTEKFNPAEALGPMEQYFTALDQIDADQVRAMAATGQKRVELLQAAMNKLKALPTEVKAGDQVVISSLAIYDQALSRFNEMQAASESAKQAELGQAQQAAAFLQTEMDRANQAMSDLQSQISTLDEQIFALNKTVTLALNDQASSPIASIKNALDQLRDKTITITADYISNVPGAASSAPSTIGGGSDPSAPFGSYSLGSNAVGTSYIPRTGLYQLHQGEQVKNRGEVARDQQSASTTSISIGDVNLSLPNVTNQTTARQLAKELLPELSNLMRGRYRSAS